MRADLRRPGDGALVHGKIRQLAPTVDLQSRNALVYVDLPKDAGLTAGQCVEGAFETGQHAVLSVPESAIVMRDGHSYVMTLEAQHTGSTEERRERKRYARKCSVRWATE